MQREASYQRHPDEWTSSLKKQMQKENVNPFKCGSVRGFANSEELPFLVI